MTLTRPDGRSYDALRPITIATGIQKNPEGSVVYACGGTKVMVAASVAEGVPDWMRGKTSGWITAEYAMHPRSGPERQRNLGRRDKPDGRASEIQRLVGRALRSAVDLDKLGPRTLTVDCDVLDADGGTRTASITGGFVALAMAIDNLRRRGLVGPGVLRAQVAAISVGLVAGVPRLDLDYPEDSKAEVDLNVVATRGGALVEVQGTAEGEPIARATFDAMLALALDAMPLLADQQTEALARVGVDLGGLLRP